MTVDTEVSSIRYTGIIDGTPVAAPFPVQSEEELTVYYGADLVATIGVHYTVALDPPDYETASVTPLAGFAALSGGVIAVNRIVPYLNTDDIPSHSTLASSRLEQMVDRVVFMAQQLRDQLARAVKYPTTDPGSAIGALPPKDTRKNKVLGFDENGVPVAVESIPVGELAISAFGTTWIALADAASALTTLGFTTLGGTGKTLTAATSAASARSTIGAVAAADSTAYTGNNTYAGTTALNGTVTVPAPSANLHPATKKYVDDTVAAAVGGGGTVINQSTSGIAYRYITAVGAGTVVPSANCKSWVADFIGAGGAGGSNAPGLSGGATVLNGVTAAGGSGGGASDSGGAGTSGPGGAAGTGGGGAATHRQSVANGNTGMIGSTTDALGGSGASTPFGAGGLTAVSAPANSGAGGGGISATTPSGGAGGGGAGELCTLVILDPDPAGYAYSIADGGAGAGGAGSGGSGVIRITERFNY